MKRDLLASVLCAFMMTSCGKNGGGSSPVSLENKEPQIQRDNAEANSMGQFLAVLKTVNEHVAGRVTGAVTLARDEDEFVGDVRFLGGPLTAATLHAQGVYSGTRCPNLDDDKNLDGFIDVKEGEEVYGKLLIPLDGDLNSQNLELGTYPFADEFGGYIYAKVASYKKLLEDLQSEDINLTDSMIKLKSAEGLNFRGKIVVISGVAKEANVPSTVMASGRFENYQALPVACGVIKKVETTPGSVDRNGYRIPRSDRAGGIAGSEDGTIITPPENNLPRIETSGATTNYGDDET